LVGVRVVVDRPDDQNRPPNRVFWAVFTLTGADSGV